jgi:hypothetical protein
VCEIKQAGIYQLTGFEKGTVPKNGQVFLVNNACFKRKLHGLLKELSIVEGSVASKPGFTKLFESDIYVQSHGKLVSVFAK